jgi:hypothetical protein
MPHLLGSQSRPPATVPQSEQVPWINTTIIIIAPNHPLRTYRGVVKDILCNQSTSSGLRVVIQLISMSMVVPVTLDYDYVLEARYAALIYLNNY